jgi:long-chain acyl-CoA synthetase
MRFGAPFIVSDGSAEEELGAMALSTSTVVEADWLRLVWSCADTADAEFVNLYPALAGVPLHQTSGTTGVPKVAVRPGRAAVEEARHYIETTGIDDRDVVVVVSPMSHAYAFGMGFMTPMLSSANVMHMREYSPKRLLDAFSDSDITVFPAVPAMLEVLLFGAGDRLRKSPRMVFAAGAPLSERVARSYREKSGVLVRPLYGTTETGGISIATVDRDGLTTGCVGAPMRGVDVEVRPAPFAEEHDGRTLETLFVRSSSMMAGYLGPDGVDRSALSDGWFQTGDLSRLDEHGSIHLRGRITEVINVGGMKVVPSEVEEVIGGLGGVREVKVYAGNSRSGTQFVKAAVVADASIDDAKVREHCLRELIYYKRPSAVLLVDSLPKTPSGKVILSELP